jgi:hypothetical protein
MITWSYSAINQFETCPAQYAAERVYKTAKRQINDAAVWGNQVHEAIELRLRDKAPLTSRFKAYESVAKLIERLEGHQFYEHKMALDRQYNPTGWKADNVWVRGILDVLVVKNDKAIALDWKTGKIRKDSLQLQLFALYVFAHFPDVNTVHTIFQWLKFAQSDKAIYYRKDIDELWKPFEEKYAKLAEAARLDIWTPRPSGLCKAWCSNTLCEYHGVGSR